MTRDEERLRRVALVLDLGACMREYGDPEQMVRDARAAAWHTALDRLECEVARWIRIIEGRRQKQQSAEATPTT